MKTLSHPHGVHDTQAETVRDGPVSHKTAISVTIPKPPSRSTQTLRLLLHFGEMLLAMLVGMVVFDVVNGSILIPMGFTSLSDTPTSSALAMAVAMTVAMVAWMRIRQHAWRLSAEMAGAMLVPTLVLIGICALGLLPQTLLMLSMHLLMVPAMLAVMLARWRAYTCH